MARKRRLENEADPAGLIPPASETETQSPVAEQEFPTVRRQRKPRIILHYAADGSVDLGGADAETRSLLESAFRAQTPMQQTDPQLVGMVITGLASVECAILSNRLGLDSEALKIAIGPNAPMDTLLAQTAAKVIDKHNLTGRWGEEIALLALLVSWQAAAFQQIRVLMATQKAEKDDAARRNMGQTETGKVNASVIPRSLSEA